MVISYIYSTCWHMKLMFYERQQQGGRLFVELAEVEDDWWWHSCMIGSMLEIGSKKFDMLVLDNAEVRMRNVVGWAEPIA
jgi:hypothetical protein